MKRFHPQWWAMLALFHGTSSWAFRAPDNPTSTKSLGIEAGIRTLRPQLHSSRLLSPHAGFGRQKIEADSLSGSIRVLTGTHLDGIGRHGLTLPSLEQAAQDFIAERNDIFQVDLASVRLRTSATYIDDDVQFLKFDVFRDGLRIEDASIDFHFKRGTLVQVINQSYGEAEPLPVASEALGQQTIAEHFSSTAKNLGKSYRVSVQDKHYVLVPVAAFDVEHEGQSYQAQVSLADGSFIELRPKLFHLHGKGQADVYPRWYTETPSTVRAAGARILTDRSSLFADRMGEFQTDASTVRLEGFDSAIVQVKPMTGSLVKVEGVKTDNAWTIHFRPTPGAPAHDDRPMAQPMIYHHTQLMVEHARKYIQPDWFKKKLVANANLGQTCNAHWDGSTINFYVGNNKCANTGLISDVVYHEWGHGLDANTGGIDDGAFSEGFGDIMSLLMTRSNILGIGFLLSGEPVRDLEPDKKYPDDQGEVHDEGLIIAGAIWDLYKELKTQYGDDQAIDMLSKFMFKGIYTASRYTELYNALLVIDDDDANINNGTPNFCPINKAFAIHGLAQEDLGCRLANLNGLEIDDSQGNNNQIIEPGERVKIYATVTNPKAVPLANLMGEMKDPGIAGITLEEKALAWDEIPARTSAKSTSAAEIHVAADVACGTQFDGTFILRSGSQFIALQHPMSIGKMPLTQHFVGTGLPLPIEDNKTLRLPIAVSGQWPDAVRVLNGRIALSLIHSYTGDLVISLVDPDGQRREIWKGSGRGQDLNLNADISNAVKGLKLTGQWYLEVADKANRDQGSLVSVTLSLTPDNFECQE